MHTPLSHSESPSTNKGQILTSLFAFLVYLATMSRVANWGDSAKLIGISQTYIEHFGAYVRASHHPLHNFFGWVFINVIPFGDDAFRVNLLSAVCGALTVGVVYSSVTFVTDSRMAGLGGAMALLFSHIHWHTSVMSESYTLYMLILAIAVSKMIRWSVTKDLRELIAASALLGLATTNRLLVVFYLPFLVIFLKLGKFNFRDVKTIAKLGLAFIIGATPLIALTIYSAIQLESANTALSFPDALWATILAVLDVDVLEDVKFDLWVHLRFFILYPFMLAYQFPVAVFLGIAGVFGMLKKANNRRNCAFLLLMLIGVNILVSNYFSARFPQRMPFYLAESFLIFAFFVGYGFYLLGKRLAFKYGELRQSPRKRTRNVVAMCLAVTIASPVIVYALAALALDKGGINPIKIEPVPYRNDSWYYFFPAKSFDDGPRQWFGAVVRQTLEGADKFGTDEWDESASLREGAKGKPLLIDFTMRGPLGYYAEQFEVSDRLNLVNITEGSGMEGRLDTIRKLVGEHGMMFIARLNPAYIPGGFKKLPADEDPDGYFCPELGPGYVIHPIDGFYVMTKKTAE
ncbi:MAG: glycosyltransferase family 39 protein [Planctomycetes bacterium]|nr:glycosyltransferase family 39 protein [Planctomycetota bacterium]